jgi:RNA polymerase sigma-B factor
MTMTSPRTRTRSHERLDRARRTDEIVAELAELDPSDLDDRVRRLGLLDELVEVHMGVAESIAARYRHRGLAEEDLQQVAYLALVRVAKTFDPTSGHDFMSYAVPSIRGEVRRHFRDHGWMVRPPRRVQETQGRIRTVESSLATRLGRPPTPTELADELGESLPEVEEAMAANGCFTPASLDLVVGVGATSTLGDQLGQDETGMGAAEARVVLGPVVRRLNERERLILELRFFHQCTQQEIADEIGVTQMQVSRLLSGLMARMREDIATEESLTPQSA